MIGRWTVRGLLEARLRTTGSVLAVAAALLLVVTFRAVWEAEAEQLAAFVENAGADVWVMQEHVANMHMATSFVSGSVRRRVERVEGVESVSAILYLNTMVEAGARSRFSYVVGIEGADQMGGPWSMSQGRAEIEAGEAIVPEILARVSGLRVGSSIRIGDRTFTVVGLSAGTFSLANPITFVHADDLADLLSLVGYRSYVLVRAGPGVDPDVLAARIRDEVGDIAALSTKRLVESDTQLARQMGSELILMMTWICAVLATMLVAFFLHLHASHGVHDLAVIKALGFERGTLYRVVIVQACLITGVAFVLAMLLALLLQVVGPRLVPVLALTFSLSDMAAIGLAAMGVALVSALTVARRVGRVDPLLVFSP